MATVHKLRLSPNTLKVIPKEIQFTQFTSQHHHKDWKINKQFLSITADQVLNSIFIQKANMK